MENMTAKETNLRGRAKLPVAVRRSSAMLLTAGLVGTSVLMAPGANAVVPINAEVAQEVGNRSSAEIAEAIAADEVSAADVWNPEPSQALLASNAFGQRLGSAIDNEIADIEGAGVLPGQSVLYEVVADLEGSTRVESLGGDQRGNPINAIVGFALEIELPADVTADLQSLQIQDSRLVGTAGGSVISSTNYRATQDDRLVRVEFTDAWVNSRLITNVTGDNELRATFDAKIGTDLAPHTEMTSQAEQIVLTPYAVFEEDEDGEQVFSHYDTRREPTEYRAQANSTNFVTPGAEPEIEVFDTSGEPVDDRIAVGGDQVEYRALLDGTLAESQETTDWEGNPTGQYDPQALNLAYSLDRFGFIKDFDADSIRINPDDVRVVAFGYDVVGDDGSTDTGNVSRGVETDVTDQFQISVSRLNGTLSVLAIDPNAVAHAGVDYEIQYRATVRNVAEDVELSSKAVQVIDDHEYEVAESSPLQIKAINPVKSAVEILLDDEGEEVGIEVLDEVPTRGDFTYEFASSEVPADALYEVKSWSLTDDYTIGDRALHDRWSVRAQSTIVGPDGKVLFEVGDVIADPDNTDYFETRPSGDSLEVVATSDFLELIAENSDEAQSWAVYVDAVRTANEGDRVSNTAYEQRNDFERRATLTSDTGAQRLEAVTPEEPTREAGVNSVSVPDVEGVEYLLSYEVAGAALTQAAIPIEGLEIKAVPAEGYTFGEDTELVTTWSFDYAATEVTEIAAPIREGDANVVTVPVIEGVEFSRHGEVVIGEDGLTITASAAPGFVIADGVAREWSFDFTPAEVPVIEEETPDNDEEEAVTTPDPDEDADSESDTTEDLDEDAPEDPIDENPRDSVVTLSTSRVAAGGSVTISADGFTVGEQVEVRLNPVLAVEQADANGEISVEVVIPEDTEPGRYQLTVVGLDSQVSGSGTITVTATEVPAGDDEQDEDAPADPGGNDADAGTNDDEPVNAPDGGSDNGSNTADPTDNGTDNAGVENSGSGSESDAGDEPDTDDEESRGGRDLSGWLNEFEPAERALLPLELPNWGDYAPGEEEPEGELGDDWGDGENFGEDRGVLARTGASGPWIVGGAALLLLAAGGGALLLNRRRMMKE